MTLLAALALAGFTILFADEEGRAYIIGLALMLLGLFLL